MKNTKQLISYRFSKNYFINKRKSNKLSINLFDFDLGSHKTCPACNSKDAYLISNIDRLGFPCDTVVCKNCDFVFNDSFIKDSISFYKNSWGQLHWGDEKKNFEKRTNIDHYSWRRFSYISNILDGALATKNKILEIGCGDGCNLYPYHLNGYKVTGLDYDKRYLLPGKNKGMNLLVGDIFNNNIDEEFDLILIIHAFEHMQDLDKVICEVKKYLSSDGLIYVEVPGIINLNQINSKRLNSGGMRSFNNFLGYIQFQHNFHFDAHHLKYFWERNGFETLSCDEWIRAIFKPIPNENINYDKINEDFIKYDFDIINHLKNVEKNFLSLSNIMRAGLSYINKKLFN